MNSRDDLLYKQRRIINSLEDYIVRVGYLVIAQTILLSYLLGYLVAVTF